MDYKEPGFLPAIAAEARSLMKRVAIATIVTLFYLPANKPLSATSMPGSPPSVPFQKIIEAVSQAIDDGDYNRLQKLEPYLKPHFAPLRHREDLYSSFDRAINQRAKQSVINILAKIAYKDVTEQLNFPENADPETLKTRVQLAYLDYYFILSREVVDIDFSADGYIKNCFRRAIQAPHTEWPERILRKLSEMFPEDVEAKKE